MDNSYVLDDVMTLNINSMDFKWIINDSKSVNLMGFNQFFLNKYQMNDRLLRKLNQLKLNLIRSPMTDSSQIESYIN